MYVLYYLMMEDCKKKRTVALTIQFFVRIMIYPLRLSSFSISSTAAVKYYFIMDIISATGAVINALHIPERWFPGKLDYVLNGHTLMHIAAFLSVVVARQGFLCDMTWLNSAGVCPTNGTTADMGSLAGFLLGVESPLWYWSLLLLSLDLTPQILSPSYLELLIFSQVRKLFFLTRTF